MSTTMNNLQQMCEIPDTSASPTFEQLWEAVRMHLRNEPKDSKGVAGPGEDKEQFLLWAINYLDSGIGQRFWGPGTEGKWSFEKDKTHILNFFRSLVAVLAKAERKYRREREERDRATAQKRRNDPKVADRKETEERRGIEVGKVGEEEEDSSNKLEGFGDGQLGEQDEGGNKNSEENQSKNEYGELYQPLSSAAKIPSTQGGFCENPNNATGQEWAVGFVKREPSLPASSSTFMSSIRKYAFESSPFPPSKRLRQPETTPSEADRAFPTTVNNIEYLTSLPKSNSSRVFETCLGHSGKTAFLFAPQTIDFQDFFKRFCEAWRKDSDERDIEDVEVKISISGVGEYQLSFGIDRKRSWLYIMKMTENKPDSSILVTMVFDQCISYRENISTR